MKVTLLNDGRIWSTVGDELLGRVVDPLGRPLDGLGEWTTTRPIERKAPGGYGAEEC